MTTFASGDPRAFAVEDDGRIAVSVGRTPDAVGRPLALAVTTAADEHALSARIEHASDAARFVPFLRVVTEQPGPSGSRGSEAFGTIVAGWIRLEPVGDGIACEAILLEEALCFERSGQASLVDPVDCLPADWWGEGHSTSRHWESTALSTTDYLAGLFKIHAEQTRDATEDLGELRRQLEALIASEIRQDPARHERAAKQVELERSLAALIDVARLGAAVRSRLRRAERELGWLWRGGTAGEAAYGRVRDLHLAGGAYRAKEPAEQSYLLAARQFVRGADTLTEEISASYELLGGVGAFAAARDAAGQAQLNRIAGAAAVLATVVGTVLALYGADLAVPGMNHRPWPLLSGLGVIVAALFGSMALASRTDDDRVWWSRAATLSLIAAVAFALLAIAQAAPPAPQTELDCTSLRAGDQMHCTGDSLVTTP